MVRVSRGRRSSYHPHPRFRPRQRQRDTALDVETKRRESFSTRSNLRTVTVRGLTSGDSAFSLRPWSNPTPYPEVRTSTGRVNLTGSTRDVSYFSRGPPQHRRGPLGTSLSGRSSVLKNRGLGDFVCLFGCLAPRTPHWKGGGWTGTHVVRTGPCTPAQSMGGERGADVGQDGDYLRRFWSSGTYPVLTGRVRHKGGAAGRRVRTEDVWTRRRTEVRKGTRHGVGVRGGRVEWAGHRERPEEI